MLRAILAFSVILICILAPNMPARAGWYEFWHRVHVDFHRNIAWPEPFASIDRKAYQVPFNVMYEKGWLRQNTIGHHHFNPETQQLTEAGQLKVRWILTHAPPNRRTVVVVRGYTAEVTAIRTDSVQQAAERMVLSDPLPEVRLTDIEARGWSADDIDAIGRRSRDAMPDPVLPEMQSADGL